MKTEHLVGLSTLFITIGIFSLSNRKITRSNGSARPWTEEEIALLRTMNDQEVADLLNISPISVWRKRRKLRIPAVGKRGAKARPWTEEEIALLGTMSNAQLAKLIGVSHSTVNKKMKDLQPTWSPKQWREYRIQQGANVKPLARKGKAYSEPWTEEETALLGTMPDVEIAKKLGVHRSTVGKKREDLEIDPLPTRTLKRDEFAGGKTGALAWELRQKGLTFSVVAATLEDMGVKTVTGKKNWNASQVYKLIKRHQVLKGYSDGWKGGSGRTYE